MRSVLMVAYNFPPEGNAGALRPLRFVRHLPNHGWNPRVLTLKTEYYERYDPKLADLVPKCVEVIPVKNPDPWQVFQARRSLRVRERSIDVGQITQTAQPASTSPLRTILRTAVHRIESWCYHPDMAMTWIWPAVNAVIRAGEVLKPDIIWATAPPWSSFLVGALSARRIHVPYVLDFRDSWTMTYTNFERERPSWAKRLDRYILRKLLTAASGVILRSETEAECFFRAYYGALDPSKIHIIPNGFEGAIGEPAPALIGEQCNILYTGTLSDYRFDTLLQAVAELKKSKPECGEQLHFHFIGEGTDALIDHARALNIDEMFSISAPLSQDLLAQITKKAHAYLILERPANMKGHELLAGAKLFGYLKSGKPILGVLPRCEARNILERIGVPTIADVTSVQHIINNLTQLLDAWRKGVLSDLAPDKRGCEIYSAEHQTKALIRALDGVSAENSFVPGRVQVPASLRGEIGSTGWITAPC